MSKEYSDWSPTLQLRYKQNEGTNRLQQLHMRTVKTTVDLVPAQEGWSPPPYEKIDIEYQWMDITVYVGDSDEVNG